MNALLGATDRFLIQQIILGAGANNNHLTLPDCTIPDETLIANYQAIEIIDSNRVPLWSGYDQFATDLAVNELTDCPQGLLFGLTGAYATYHRAKGFMCCNDQGVDANAVANGLNNVAPFQSKNVEWAFGNAPISLLAADAANAAVLVHPGSAHLLEIFKYDHNAFVDGMSMGMVWTDPRSGERFDLKVFYDCQETRTMTFSKNVNVFTAPTDQYDVANDDLCNSNGIMLYNFIAAP